MVFLVFWDSIPKRCKGVHCVDLGESFQTSIYLQNLASIQPRTSLVKFARSPRTVRIIIIIMTSLVLLLLQIAKLRFQRGPGACAPCHSPPARETSSGASRREAGASRQNSYGPP